MPIPVALFAYARTDYLAETLRGLRENGVPLIYAFSDGPKTPAQREDVERVRAVLRAVDWAEVRLVEQSENLGLGRSIRAGVEAVLAEHDTIVVFEDDMACAPGTYAFFCEALERYRDEPAVMSVTGFTHPRRTPRDVDAPYFDGRAECWTWGTWRRAWRGMDRDAMSHMRDAAAQGIDPRRYGSDLPRYAAMELERNIWAVRWIYLHIAQRGLCLRPPRSLVNHIGVDARATNAGGDTNWLMPVLGPPPAAPVQWPAPVEHPDCAALWSKVIDGPWPRRAVSAARRALRRWTAPGKRA